MSRSPKPRLNRARSLVLGLAWVGFACRLVVPAGYMPASPEESGFIKLCPAGATGVFLRGALGEHEAHGHGGGTDSSTHDHEGDHNYDTDYCPVGAFFSSATAISGFKLDLIPAAPVLPAAREPARAAAPRFAHHQPRAPPVSPA